MNKDGWSQVPGMYIWQNVKGDTIEIRGTHDEGYYYVTYTRKRISIGRLGKVVKKRLSPYFVFSEGVGEQGRSSNAFIRRMYNWQPGNLQNALNVVKKFIRR